MIARRTPLIKSAAPARRLLTFGPPPLIEGEDGNVYDAFLARLSATVKPADIIEEMSVADVARLHWEVLRWHRLKSNLIRARGLKALGTFLRERLDYDLYAEFCGRPCGISSRQSPQRPGERCADAGPRV